MKDQTAGDGIRLSFKRKKIQLEQVFDEKGGVKLQELLCAEIYERSLLSFRKLESAVTAQTKVPGFAISKDGS